MQVFNRYLSVNLDSKSLFHMTSMHSLRCSYHVKIGFPGMPGSGIEDLGSGMPGSGIPGSGQDLEYQDRGKKFKNLKIIK